MKTGVKKKNLDPLIVGRKGRNGTITYIIRLYDLYLTVGENLSVTLEIFIKLFFILKIKGEKKNIALFKDFWLGCCEIQDSDIITKSLITKLNVDC